MTTHFNADEIFEMAEQIERNGARFYRRAAQAVGDPGKQKLFFQLVAMEAEHERVFSFMREELSAEEGRGAAFDPDDQTGQYLQAAADGKIFNVNADPEALFDIGERLTVEDILRAAIGMEKESIIFYLGMKSMVPDGLGKDKIDGIVKEEMSHIGALSMELAAQMA